MVYGYCRVSTSGQVEGNSLEDQRNSITNAYPEAEVIEEAYSGAKERPLFSELLDRCEKDDILVVTKLDRFCRSAKEGLEYIDRLTERGVKVHILNMGMMDNTPMGRVMVTMLLAFAEFERSQIIERTQAGKALARQREGYREGRPVKEVPLMSEYRRKVTDGLLSVTEACRELGISRSKWYKFNY